MRSSREKIVFRPLHGLVVVLAMIACVHVALFFHARQLRERSRNLSPLWDITTSALGLTDLCIATEARYTRNPAVTDPVAPFMDSPWAIEHFPTGSFWAPPDLWAGEEYHR